MSRTFRPALLIGTVVAVGAVGLAYWLVNSTYTDFSAMAKQTSFVETKILAEVKRAGNDSLWTGEKFSAYVNRLEIASDTARAGLALKEFSIKANPSGRWVEISFRDPEWSHAFWSLHAQIVSTDLLGPVQAPHIVIRAVTLNVIGNDRYPPPRSLERVLDRARSDFNSVSEAALAKAEVGS